MGKCQPWILPGPSPRRLLSRNAPLDFYEDCAYSLSHGIFLSPAPPIGFDIIISGLSWLSSSFLTLLIPNISCFISVHPFITPPTPFVSHVLSQDLWPFLSPVTSVWQFPYLSVYLYHVVFAIDIIIGNYSAAYIHIMQRQIS